MVFEVEVDEAGIGRRRGGGACPCQSFRPDASCLLSLLGRLLVVSLIASTPECRESVVMARGPCRTHTHTLTPTPQTPCTLAPLMEWRFDAVTPVLRHVLQHPSQGQATLNLGTAQ